MDKDCTNNNNKGYEQCADAAKSVVVVVVRASEKARKENKSITDEHP